MTIMNQENGKVIRLGASFRAKSGARREIGRSCLKDVVSARDYFRTLRAAEMAAWELTGGDVVISAVFAGTEPLAA
jgi:hypothetical protein